MSQQVGECPLCHSGMRSQVAPELYYCTKCHIVYNTGHRIETYEQKYFMDDYRKQYGKTYEEDFQVIYNSSNKRLDRIFSLIPKGSKSVSLSLLDIGSAFGYFLQCARDRGIQKVRGVEISRFASQFCRDHFLIDVDTIRFPEMKPAGTYDIITAWYFIEHTESPPDTIKSIYSMLNPGGVIAFSAPSIHGPMFQFHRNQWIDEHPGDHRMDFSPAAVKMILSDIGFKKIQLSPSGFHPERIISSESLLFRPFRFVYRWIAEWAVYSDTIEVYAVK